MSSRKFFLIFLFCFISNIFLTHPIKSTNIKSEDNKISRVVALTSLSADLVNYLSNESLLGIPGSSLLKNNKDFSNKTVISSGRMPPDLEKILSLKPDLVIGAKGFHDRPHQLSRRTVPVKSETEKNKRCNCSLRAGVGPQFVSLGPSTSGRFEYV